MWFLIIFGVVFIFSLIIFIYEICTAPIIDSKLPFLKGDVGYDEFVNNPINKEYINQHNLNV